MFQLSGSNGSEVFKFEAGADSSQIVSAVNLLSDSTGVSAALSVPGGDIVLTSLGYGSDSFIDVEVISEGPGSNGNFSAAVVAPRVQGTDIVALVNGASTLGKGNTLSINNSTLSMSMTLDSASVTSVNFAIVDGGAQFQLGPDVVSNQQARIGIRNLNTAKLGGPTGRLFELGSDGPASLAKDVNRAGEIIDQVINKVSTLRGRLGAFQRTALESNSVSLNDTLTNLTEAESSIRDADFAKETAALSRAQILVQSGTSVLGIANQSSQSVLSLLQR